MSSASPNPLDISQRKLVTFPQQKARGQENTPAPEALIFDRIDAAARADVNLAHYVLRALNGDGDVEVDLRGVIARQSKDGLGLDITIDSEVMNNVFMRLRNQASVYQEAVNRSKESSEIKRNRGKALAYTGVAAGLFTGGGFLAYPYLIEDPQAIVRPAETFDIPSPIKLSNELESPASGGGSEPDPNREFSFATMSEIISLLGDSNLEGDALRSRDDYVNEKDFHIDDSLNSIFIDLPIGDQGFRDGKNGFPIALAYRLSQTAEFTELNDDQLLDLANKVVDQFRKLRSLYTSNRKRPPSPFTPVVIKHPLTDEKTILVINDALLFNEDPKKITSAKHYMKKYYPLSLTKAFEIEEHGSTSLSSEEIDNAKNGDFIFKAPIQKSAKRRLPDASYSGSKL